MDDQIRQFLESHSRDYAPEAIRAFEYAEGKGGTIEVLRSDFDSKIREVSINIPIYPIDFTEVREIWALAHPELDEDQLYARLKKENGVIPAITLKGKVAMDQITNAPFSRGLAEEIRQYIKEQSSLINKFARLIKPASKTLKRNTNREMSKTSDQMLEQMAETLKPEYPRESEESPLESKWNRWFEPEYCPDDSVLRTFKKSGLETIGNLLKGTVAPYFIPTAKRVSDETVSGRRTSEAKIVAALASAIFTLYMTGDPAVDKIKDYMSKSDAATLVEKARSLETDRARLENKIQFAENKLKTAEPEDAAGINSEIRGYKSRITQTEQQKKAAETEAKYLAKGYPVNKWKLIFPTLFGMLNAASAFYERHRKKGLEI